MKLCVAQTRPVKGDIPRNIEKHKALIALATAQGADIIIFPELSVTGYEPELANELAANLDDSRFDHFQTLCDAHQITIGVGMPTRSKWGIQISLFIFQPHQPRQAYAKQHLHSDEYPYFISGKQPLFLKMGRHTIGLAICYELSVPKHSKYAYKNGVDIYIASVAKSAEGVQKASEMLSDIAKTYSMTVLMANCVGHCDTFDCGGQSAIWTSDGSLAGQLNKTNEGILIIDAETGELTEKLLLSTANPGL